MTRLQGRVVIEELESEVLTGNLPGDPTLRQMPVYLPPSYDKFSDRQFPVLYCLAGFTGAGRSFLNYSAWAPNFPERVDALITRGAMPEVILVMPDCMTRYGGSQYLNSSATGRYQDYVADEIVSFVDHKYRTHAHRDGRGLVGKSSGGYGSLVMAMQRSDVFSAAACHSGDMYFEYCYLPDVPKAASAITQGGGLGPWLEHFEKSSRKKSADFAAINVVAMAAAYSPHPSAAPLGFDLPFDAHSGEFREDVWLRWLDLDPVRMLDEYREALQSLRLLFIDCGSQDEYNLHLGARILHAKLEKMGLRHVYEEFPDGHRDVSYRYEESIPALARVLEGAS
jgi:enterochelin esterase-like enzyme